MPMHHHHHENKRDKSKERNMQKAHRGLISTIDINENPLPALVELLPSNEVSNAIREIVGQNDDTFQDVWVAVVERRLNDLEVIKQIARDIKLNNDKKTVGDQYRTISLEKPLNQDESDGHTLLDILPSPEIGESPPEKDHSVYGKAYIYKQGMDEDVVKYLKQKYPGENIRHALRMALNLPVKDTKHWKQAEIIYLKKQYPEGNVQAIALELGRTVYAVKNKAVELKLRVLKRKKRIPEGCFGVEGVCHLFSFSKRHLEYILSQRLLPWQKYQNMKVFHRSDIITFIRTHPFEYRHDLLSAYWLSFVPEYVKEWLTIEEIARRLNYSHYQIRRDIKLGQLAVKYYCKHTKPIAYITLPSISNLLEIDKIKQPYKVAVMGEKRHYVFWDSDHELAMVCQPHGHTVSDVVINRFGYNPFVKGFPTCLKCLKILKKLDANRTQCN